jgi:hypothetical protein
MANDAYSFTIWIEEKMLLPERPQIMPTAQLIFKTWYYG